MPIHALDNLATKSTGGLFRAQKPAEDKAFQQALALKKGSITTATSMEKLRTQAHVAAKQFVATAFIQPVLGQLQKDPLRGKMFHGGFAEDAFQGKLDTVLSDRMVDKMDMRTGGAGDGSTGAGAGGQIKSGGMALVNAVYKKIIAPAERHARIVSGQSSPQALKVSLHG